MLRRPLPDDLPVAFTVAEARTLGVPHPRMSASDLVAPFHGARIPAALADDRLTRLHALAQLTPHAALSHETAANLWRLPLPAQLQRDTPIHLTVAAGDSRIERRGVVGHVADRAVVRHSSGLLVTALGDTWCDLAPSLTITQLAQAGDAILNRRGWDITMLGAAVDGARRRRGCRKLRAALSLVRPGSRSPRETETRLLFASWGLPEPELNVDLFTEAGWLACVDFLWRDRRLVAEYYGRVHGPTWQEDLTRAALIEDEGYRVVVITDEDVHRRQDALRRRMERLLG